MSAFFFFFSSRRRHTRLQGDWSSDVCSSDLSGADPAYRGLGLPLRAVLERPPRQARGISQSEQKERLTMPTAGTSPTTPLLRITVPRRIEASPEEVFDAWAEIGRAHV